MAAIRIAWTGSSQSPRKPCSNGAFLVLPLLVVFHLFFLELGGFTFLLPGGTIWFALPFFFGLADSLLLESGLRNRWLAMWSASWDSIVGLAWSSSQTRWLRLSRQCLIFLCVLLSFLNCMLVRFPEVVFGFKD